MMFVYFKREQVLREMVHEDGGLKIGCCGWMSACVASEVWLRLEVWCMYEGKYVLLLVGAFRV